LDFLAMIVMNKIGFRILLVQLCALGIIIDKLDFLVIVMNKIRFKGSCHDNEWTLVTTKKLLGLPSDYHEQMGLKTS
jgi:hypothetical protein